MIDTIIKLVLAGGILLALYAGPQIFMDWLQIRRGKNEWFAIQRRRRT